MLQSLSDKVQLCYERAAEAKERAEETSDLEAKADFLAMEQRWLLLARSYQFSESLDDFTRWSSSRHFDLVARPSDSAGAAAKRFDPADVTPIRGHETDVAAILTNTPFLLTRCSSDLRFFVNEAYARMLGRRREDFDARLIVDIMGEEGFRTILPYVEKVLRGEGVEYETDVQFAWVRVGCLSNTRQTETNGEAFGVGSRPILDLTDQKKADAQIPDLQAMTILRDLGTVRYGRWP
jgi:PAS domain-containing protein